MASNSSATNPTSTTTTDRVRTLKRDLMFLRGKKERLVIKKRELEVEEQLLNQKIYALEDELRTEEKRVKVGGNSTNNNNGSIDATISEVIANVMCNASSSSSSSNNSFSASSDNNTGSFITSGASNQSGAANLNNSCVNNTRSNNSSNSDGINEVQSHRTNNSNSTSSRNGFNPVSNVNSEVPPLRNPFLIQNGDHQSNNMQSNHSYRNVPLSSPSSQLPSSHFSLNWNLPRMTQHTFPNILPHMFCAPTSDQANAHQNSLLNVFNMSRSRFQSPVVSTATTTLASTSTSLNPSANVFRPSNVPSQKRTVSSSSSNDAFDTSLTNGQETNRILFQNLPLTFSDIRTLIAPTLIVTDSFSVTIPQNLVKLFIEDKFNISLRLCIYKRSKEFQSDRMARAIKITVNDILVPLAKNSAKAIKSPITITNLLLHAQNKVVITLPENSSRIYAVGVYALKKVPIGETLQQLKQKDFMRPEAETLEIIKRKFSSSSDIVSESILIPLTCPITKRRLMIPAVGSKCEHLSCFEAQVFLEMNLNKDEWICPVCNRPIGTAELICDGLTVKIIRELDSKCMQVEFFVDGSYKPVVEKKPVENTVMLLGKSSSDIVLIDLSDDDSQEQEEESAPQQPVRKPLAPASSQQRRAENGSFSRYQSTYRDRNYEDYQNEGEIQNDNLSIIDHEHNMNNTLESNDVSGHLLSGEASQDPHHPDHLSDLESSLIHLFNEKSSTNLPFSLNQALNGYKEFDFSNDFLSQFSDLTNPDLHDDSSKRRRTHSPPSRTSDSGDNSRRSYHKRKGPRRD